MNSAIIAKKLGDEIDDADVQNYKYDEIDLFHLVITSEKEEVLINRNYISEGSLNLNKKIDEINEVNGLLYKHGKHFHTSII